VLLAMHQPFYALLHLWQLLACYASYPLQPINCLDIAGNERALRLGP
jgi:hypothetical protein